MQIPKYTKKNCLIGLASIAAGASLFLYAKHLVKPEYAELKKDNPVVIEKIQKVEALKDYSGNIQKYLTNHYSYQRVGTGVKEKTASLEKSIQNEISNINTSISTYIADERNYLRGQMALSYVGGGSLGAVGTVWFLMGAIGGIGQYFFRRKEES